MIEEDKKEYVYLLGQLIQYYENDLAVSDAENHTLIVNEMIIAVTRFVNNIRYCSKVNCPCSPEAEIKNLYEKHGYVFANTRHALFPIPFKTFDKIIDTIE